MRKNWIIVAALVLCAGIAELFVPVRLSEKSSPSMSRDNKEAGSVDLSAYSDAPLQKPLDLLFIHHSCGGQLFAAPGANQGTNCIYTSHPNGGGLRARLEQNSYRVHEASYESRIGQN